MKLIDLVGVRFGRLLVVSRAVSATRRTRWKCLCDCGVIKTVGAEALVSHRTSSCGCLAKEVVRNRSIKHGDTVNYKISKEYGAWCGAKGRCYNPKDEKYPVYGERGILMSQRWRDSYADFISDMGRCPSGYSLDRINVNGNYEKDNCRWADDYTQSRNRTNNVWITYRGETKIQTDWANHFHIDKRTFSKYYRLGFTVDQIILRFSKVKEKNEPQQSRNRLP